MMTLDISGINSSLDNRLGNMSVVKKRNKFSSIAFCREMFSLQNKTIENTH